MAGVTKSRVARPRPAGRKTANRFSKLAGGEDLDTNSTNGPDSPGGGLISAMTVAADEQRIVEIDVNEVVPHPFNDPARSQPQPGNPKWDELVNGVRAQGGVKLPALAVPREAFLSQRPKVTLPDTARYVLIYGHRRRAAAIAVGIARIPAVIDAGIMENDGDIDAMAIENLGREDLSPMAEAELFARYADMGLSQSEIAERLGVNQSTVSRRLALLLLAPELQEAVEHGGLPSAEAAVIAQALPYGPPRKGRKPKDAGQGTDARRGEQIHALKLIRDQRWLASRAVERVLAERAAREQAAHLNVEIVEDIAAELGEDYHQHHVRSHQEAADVIAAIDPSLGTLVFYRRDLPDHDDPPLEHPEADNRGSSSATAAAEEEAVTELGSVTPLATDADGHDAPSIEPIGDTPDSHRDDPAKQAHRLRSGACAVLIDNMPPAKELLKVFVGQYLSGVAARSRTSAVSALLRDWDAVADGEGDKARTTRAWHRAVAAAELHTAELKEQMWDDAAVAHVQMLVDRVGYQPTAWERERLTRGGR